MRTVTRGPFVLNYLDPTDAPTTLYDAALRLGRFWFGYNHFARAIYFPRRGGGQHTWPLPFVDRKRHLG